MDVAFLRGRLALRGRLQVLGLQPVLVEGRIAPREGPGGEGAPQGGAVVFLRGPREVGLALRVLDLDWISPRRRIALRRFSPDC